MGTFKYKDENYYSKFIQTNGGMKNAATTEDHTYYFFDVRNDKIEEGLDIYSQFFIKPLFSENATKREMNVIDSEYKRNISNEGKATYQIEKSYLSVPGSTI